MLHDPTTSLELGTRYLRQMLDRFGGRVERALAAYNAGPHRVDAWTRAGPDMPAEEFVESIPFTETRNYVMTILANREHYRRLYGARPRRGRPRDVGRAVSFRIGDFKRKIDPALLKREGKTCAATAAPRTSCGR